MKKNKLIIALSLLLVLLIALTLVACDKRVTEEEEPSDPTVEEAVSRTQIINNGTFYNATSSASSTDYLKDTVNGWTFTKGTLEKGNTGVTVGAVDLTDTEGFGENAPSFYSGSAKGTMPSFPAVDPKTPKDEENTTENQDNNALVLSSSTAGSIYAALSSFTLSANKYYKIQFSVWTDVGTKAETEADKKGAYVVFNGGIYAVYEAINTERAWKTYEIYVTGNPSDSYTVSINAWLGHGPANVRQASTSSVQNKRLTAGTVLFDNFICTEIDDTGYGTAIATPAADSKSFDLNYPDKALEQYVPTASSEYQYTFKEGTQTSNNASTYYSLTDDADTAISSTNSGIVDLSKMYYYDETATDEAKKYVNTFKAITSNADFEAPDRKYFMNDDGTFNTTTVRGTMSDTKALMIYLKTLSSAKYQSKKTLLIEKDMYYEISVWAYVWKIAAPSYTGTDVTASTMNTSFYEAVAAASKHYELAADKTAALSTIAAKDNDDVTYAALAHYFVNAAADHNLDEAKAYYEGLGTEEDKLLFAGAYLCILGDNAAAKATFTAGMDTDTKSAVDTKASAFKTDHGAISLTSSVTDATKTENNFDTKYKAYANNVKKRLEYNAAKDAWERHHAALTAPKAFFDITGAGDVDAVYTTAVGSWEKLSIKIRGNQLTNRNVNLEFHFGEGLSTDYDTLMYGGVFFDNIEITRLAEADVEESLRSGYTILSPLKDENTVGGLVDAFVEGGDNTVPEGDIEDTEHNWTMAIAEGTADADVASAEIVKGDTYKIGNKVYDVVVLNNETYTASSLYLTKKAEVKILPNKYYRFSMLLKTADIDEALSATVNLMSREDTDDAKYATATSVSSLNSEEWTEVVFYIRGDSLVANYVTFAVTLGTGTRFDTSKYVKGSVSITAVTCITIDSEDFDKDGDHKAKKEFANTTASNTGVTNGNFGGINVATTDEDAFDANGKLTGVAVTNNWTESTAKENSFNAPTNLAFADGNFTWTGSVNNRDEKPDGYEVYATNFKLNEGTDDEKTYDKIYIGYVACTAANGDYTFSVNYKESCSLTVRAVAESGVSSYATAVAYEGNAAGASIPSTDYTGTQKKETVAGTIVYDDEFSADTGSYVSPYKTGLKISSNYAIMHPLASTAVTLDADKYYEIKVWVKTLGDAFASIALDNPSNTLQSSDDFIGYTKIKTAGKWVEYRFYIQTGDSSGSPKIILALGNYYGTAGEEGGKTVYGDDVVSNGTVYFDNVRCATVTEEVYKKYTETLKDDEYKNTADVLSFVEYEYVWDNKVAFKTMLGKIDSFDSFTANTTDDSILGDTPKAYTYKIAVDGTNTNDARTYGIFGENSSDELLTNLYTDKDGNKYGFIPENFDIKKFIQINGSNALVLANRANNGQAYKLTTNKTAKKDTAYKLSFKAKFLGDAGKYGEFRYFSDISADADSYEVIKLTGNAETVYTMYINNLDADKTISWSFNLGGDSTDSKLTGILVIDDVSLEVIDAKDDFNDQYAEYQKLSDDDKKNAATRYIEYEKQEEEDDDSSTETPATEEEDEKKDSIFDRGEIWLLVSTIVLGVLTIVTVVVVLVKKFKKKHPKKVKGENVVNTEKVPLEVITANNEKNEKDDLDEFNEFVDKKDETKPKYVQRVTNKHKHKK